MKPIELKCSVCGNTDIKQMKYLKQVSVWEEADINHVTEDGAVYLARPVLIRPDCGVYEGHIRCNMPSASGYDKCNGHISDRDVTDIIYPEGA